MMPGSSSDAPGTITVYAKDGRELSSVSISMMQEIYDVRWEKKQVSLRSGKTIELSRSQAQPGNDIPRGSAPRALREVD